MLLRKTINLYSTPLVPTHCMRYTTTSFRDLVELFNWLYKLDVAYPRHSILRSLYRYRRRVAFHPVLFHRKADHVGYRDSKNIARGRWGWKGTNGTSREELNIFLAPFQPLFPRRQARPSRWRGVCAPCRSWWGVDGGLR